MDEDGNEFDWGLKKMIIQKSNDVQYYKSFTFKGELYSLFDCVYVYTKGAVDTYIGKIVKMYETSNCERMVKILWFLRPVEMRSHLNDVEVMWNELFLASGYGPGLTNAIDVSSIIGKCHVLCISKDKRITVSEIRPGAAEYIFYRTFDVGKQVISKIFPDEIAGIKVEFLLNSAKGQKPITPSALQKQGEKINMPVMIKSNKYEGSPLKNSVPTIKNIIAIKGVEPECRNSSESPKIKRSSVPNGTRTGRELKDLSKVRCLENSFPENTKDSLPLKKRPKVLDGNGSCFPKENLCKGIYVEEKAIKTAVGTQLVSDRGPKTHDKFTEVTTRPGADKRNWFIKLPWDGRLVKAQDAGALVMLENLDPSFTSHEVEDLVWHALKEKVQARMIESSTYSTPLYGKAYVIFKSKVAADTAIYELDRRCLVLGDGRPVNARRRKLMVPSKNIKFHGHLEIEELKQRQSHDKRIAISTAHCSQSNTIEYDFAQQWLELQERLDLQWKSLSQEHLKEIIEVKSKLTLIKKD